MQRMAGAAIFERTQNALDSKTVKVKNTFLEVENSCAEDAASRNLRRSYSAPACILTLLQAESAVKHEDGSDSEDAGEIVDNNDEATTVGQSFTSTQSAPVASFSPFPSTSASAAAASSFDRQTSFPSTSVASTPASSFNFPPSPTSSCSASFEYSTDPGEQRMATSSAKRRANAPESPAKSRLSQAGGLQDMPARLSGLWGWMRPATQSDEGNTENRATFVPQARRQHRSGRHRQVDKRQHEKRQQLESEAPSPQFPFVSAAAAPEDQIAAISAAVKDRLKTQSHTMRDEKTDHKERTPNFCSACGGALLAKTKFCRFCGAPIA